VKLYSEDIILIKDYLQKNKDANIKIIIFGDIIISKYKEIDTIKPELKTFFNSELELSSKDNFLIKKEPLCSEIFNFIEEIPDVYNISRLIEYSEISLIINDNLINSRIELLRIIIEDFKEGLDVNVFNVYYKINNIYYKAYLILNTNTLVKDYYYRDNQNKILLLMSDLKIFLSKFEVRFIKIEPNLIFKTLNDLIDTFKMFENENTILKIKKNKYT